MTCKRTGWLRRPGRRCPRRHRPTGEPRHGGTRDVVVALPAGVAHAFEGGHVGGPGHFGHFGGGPGHLAEPRVAHWAGPGPQRPWDGRGGGWPRRGAGPGR